VALVLLQDTGDHDGMWRDPMGELCRKLKVDDPDAKRGYVLLDRGRLLELVKRHPREALVDAEKLTDCLAVTMPGVVPYLRPEE
jgi:hypothetical protein